MKLIKIILLTILPLTAISQKHCRCNAEKIAGWDTRDKGLNEEVLNGRPEFQHPVTTFYRNQGSWYNPDNDQSQNLNNLRVTGLLSLSVAMALLIGACDGDDIPCPEVNQPPIQELNKWEKQRFPYGYFDTLVFVIEELKIGRQDTVKLGRILYDSSVVNHGDSVNVETACKKAYESRTQEYLAIYGTDYKDRLTFKNDMDYYGISVEWDEYSTGFSHNVLNDHYGEKNDNLNQDDTVIIKNKVYENVYKASEKHGDLSRRNYYYSFLNGFVFIHDKEIQKKWYLLEAY